MAEAGVVLGLDYGLRQIGVATGQAITGTASPLTVIKSPGNSQQPDWEALGKIIGEWKPGLLLVGLPLNMDGSRSEFCEQAERFARQLEGRFNLPVQLVDERLSSVEAKQLRPSENYNARPVDDLAASIIVETWLSEHKKGA